MASDGDCSSIINKLIDCRLLIYFKQELLTPSLVNYNGSIDFRLASVFEKRRLLRNRSLFMAGMAPKRKGLGKQIVG
jgi:hypothetical protein